MKFLCPSCKAKYQIADEKVAGRSVRMKCRKCGFMIQVSSAMAASGSLGSDPPEALNEVESSVPPPPPAAGPLVSKPTPAPSPVVPRATPAVGPKASPSKGAPLPAPRPPPGKAAGLVPKPAAPPARPTGPKVATAAVPRVGDPAKPTGSVEPSKAPEAAKASEAAKSAEPAKAAEPAEAAKVQPAKATEAGKAAAASDVPRDFESDDEVTRMADAGALAGAFSQAFGGVGNEVATDVAAPLSMPGDEWFVGINGVPVGPIRLSELRSKAASGAVSKESLVWRDGFEDWRPLKTYPELVAIVEEGVSSARASLTPFTPPASEAHDVTAKPAVTSAVDPFARASLPSAVTGSAVVTDDISALVPPRRGTSPMVWVAMVIAIGLGLTIGFVLFGGQKATETKIVEKIVEVPAKGTDTGAPAANNTLPETVAAADPQAPKKATGGTSKSPANPDGDTAKQNPGLKGLNGLSGLGPSTGPATGGPSGAVGGGGQLDGGQIQSTVARYTGSVKRRCWQPALDARARDAPMTAKVTVTITVGGTGSVQNATTTGDPRGYTGLANCIASSVRSWQFPAAGGTTIANVPFVFAGQ